MLGLPRDDVRRVRAARPAHGDRRLARTCASGGGSGRRCSPTTTRSTWTSTSSTTRTRRSSPSRSRRPTAPGASPCCIARCGTSTRRRPGRACASPRGSPTRASRSGSATCPSTTCSTTCRRSRCGDSTGSSQVRSSRSRSSRSAAGRRRCACPRAGSLLHHGVTGVLDSAFAQQQHVNYAAGAMILDAEDPSIVLARTAEPLLAPETEEERSGIVPNVVFPTAIERDRRHALRLLRNGRLEDRGRTPRPHRRRSRE